MVSRSQHIRQVVGKGESEVGASFGATTHGASVEVLMELHNGVRSCTFFCVFPSRSEGRTRGRWPSASLA